MLLVFFILPLVLLLAACGTVVGLLLAIRRTPGVGRCYLRSAHSDAPTSIE